MTKEQILIGKYSCKDLDDLKKCFLNNTESLSMILEAMEEYKNSPDKLTKCYNCGEMVEMVSEGEFCPKCIC